MTLIMASCTLLKTRQPYIARMANELRYKLSYFIGFQLSPNSQPFFAYEHGQHIIFNCVDSFFESDKKRRKSLETLIKPNIAGFSGLNAQSFRAVTLRIKFFSCFPIVTGNKRGCARFERHNTLSLM